MSRLHIPETPLFREFTLEEIEASIPDRFEQQVVKRPRQTAVRSSDETLSYSELNSWANRIARTILEVIGPGENRIALLLSSGASMIATVLGTLKAGAMYVPLDPEHPVSRIRAILDDSQARLIVGDHGTQTVASKLIGAKRAFFNIDELHHTICPENVGVRVTPDTPAYIIYTSGSTGNPKGVVENHRNVLHNVMTNTNILKISSDDKLSLIRAVGAAGAVRDMFSVLLNGGGLHIFPVKTRGATKLGHWLTEHGITIYSSAVTVFRQFTSSLAQTTQLPDLRLIYVGGDTVMRDDLELYKRNFSENCFFINRLGATETGTVAYYIANKDTIVSDPVVPVGYPCHGKEVLIVDETGRELSPGEVGEIAVRSPYLALEYWRNQELTDRAFARDAHNLDWRLYRTGDLGEMMPDGCLIHLGRQDFQLNIRGQRVDLREIELALTEHPAVAQAVINAVAAEPQKEQLIAYLVIHNEMPIPTITRLRAFLKERLPEYMLPAKFEILESFPISSAGKVDRASLPLPSTGRPDVDAPFMLPRNPVEEALVGIWQDVLEIKEIGVYDNFFEMGGHSLLMTQLLARLSGTFGIEVSMKTFFEAPTIADLVSLLCSTPSEKERVEHIAQLLVDIARLSDDEVKKMIAEKTLSSNR